MISDHGEPAKTLFHATSRDGGRFSVRQGLPTAGVLRHPQMAAGDDGSNRPF